ncbi:hypothetical protein SRT_04310 [Streptococcus troglodytae]|uniref:Uncharacterized protein n=1 Tax=Streptococcus troglodytae TaxID=1111760 RepID=A0A1L7LI57_9STRE|nr:hypothetical protein [Streptococcus troglodytae]BAQ23692.1 hypothetical protein SRT_04310 [Streptococcus troglodytae]
MILDIEEKLARMQAKYIDRQDSNHLDEKVESRKTAKIKKN